MENKGQNICVGVGVILFKEGKILLGTRLEGTARGEYSFPGGKLDPGESLEDCARREVKEECGLGIKNIQFSSVFNIPGKKYDQLLTIIFTADWESGELVSDPEESIGGWNWYVIDELPEPMFNLSQIGIDLYKSGQNFFDRK